MKFPSQRVRSSLVPVGVFLALLILTSLVWRQQYLNRRSLVTRHTSDVCVQAARRLETTVASHMSVAGIFARRWSTHEHRDFSKQRFEEFAAVLLDEMPGYHSFTLAGPEGELRWTVPERGRGEDALPDFGGLLPSGWASRGLVMSGPVAGPSGETTFLALFPLERPEEFLGYLVVEFHAEALIDACFHDRIRSEFAIQVQDGATTLYRYPKDAPVGQAGSAATTEALRLYNRNWDLSISPRAGLARALGWRASAAIPLFGLALSVGLSWLVFLLQRRMEMYREAHERSQSEIAARKEAQETLAAVEERYRNVFDSATNGLLILSQEDCVVEANPAACVMHGYRPDEIVGKPVANLIAPESRGLYGAFREGLAASGLVRLDAVDIRKDGTRLDVELRGAAFQFGGRPHALAILTDVSDRKVAEKRHALLSRKVLIAQEEERARLSRELHDELGQLLTAMRLELGWLQRKTVERDNGLKGALGNTIDIVETAANELRRICRGLRPPLLDDLGLEPALLQLIDEFQDRSGINTDVDIRLEEDDGNVGPDAALCTYRVLQESLTNVSRHSGARNVRITLTHLEARLELAVYDDGEGAPMDRLTSLQGSGLAGMRERANLVNGVLDVRSTLGQGTRVVLTIPLPPERKEVRL